MLTKRQVRMVQLALASRGKPVASFRWISDGFVSYPQGWDRPDEYALYYNVGRDTKVMVWKK